MFNSPIKLYSRQPMENIFTTAKPFLSFARILGLFPFAFKGPARKGFLTLSWSGVISSCCLVLALSLFIVFNFLSNQNAPANHWAKQRLEKAWTYSVRLELFSYFCLFFYQIYNHKRILRFLTLIEELDENVMQDADFEVEFLIIFHFHSRQKKWELFLITIVIESSAMDRSS